MLDEADTVAAEDAVAFVIVHGPGRGMEGRAIDFEDAPAAVVADEEVRLLIGEPISASDPREAVGEEEHTARSSACAMRRSDSERNLKPSHTLGLRA